MSVNQNFSVTSPSLLLDFSNSKTLDPRITFTRSSTATYVASNGLIKTAVANEPRFDHNFTTGESLGLLIEEQRTNILLYSTFSFSAINSYPLGWTSFNPGRVVRSSSTAPDLTDAAIVGKQFGNSGGFRPSNISISTSTNYTVSWYARRPTDSELSLFLSYYPTNGTTGQSYVKGSRMRYDDVVGGTGSSTIVTLTDSWTRFSYTFNSGASTSFSPNFTTMDVSENYAANDLFVIAGVQVEAGAFPTSYIPTSATTVTRSSDYAYMDGTNFSSWYNATEGTLFSNFTVSNDTDGSRFYVDIDNGANNAAIEIRSSEINFLRGIVSSSGSQQANMSVSSSPIGNNCSAAIAYKLNDFAFTVNGQSPASDISGLIPGNSCIKMNIGSYENISHWINTSIKRIMYYPKRLTDTQLQNLTK